MLLAIFGLATLLNLVGSAVGSEALAWATKPLLMPLLAVWLWRTAGPKAKGIVAGLLLSAAGDIALLIDGTGWFIAGMVLFLGAHICYITTFLRAGARPRPLIAAVYVIVFAAALAWLWKPLGGLAFPMMGYGAALATMATLAASITGRVGIGGALFFLSDLLIAVNVAEAATLPGPPIWVMLTYCAGQFLIATGWCALLSSSDDSRP